MGGYDIDKISKSLGKSEREAIKNLDKSTIQSRVGNLDISEAVKKMRQLNLNEAADKLAEMNNSDLVNMIASNPEIVDKLKSIFK